MITIAPSLLACNFLHLEQEVRAFENETSLWLHLDIMDGHFVPNLTFGKAVLQNLKKITAHPLDAHLMVKNPEFFIEDYKDLGLHNFTFHLEACENPLGLIKKAKKIYPSVGISIKPNTSVEKLSDELLQALDLILIMSVEPGFGGQSFIPEALDKVQNLVRKKEQNQYSYQIQIDGGINQETASLAIKAGVTNLVAGSYIFKSKDYSQAVASLRKG